MMIILLTFSPIRNGIDASLAAKSYSALYLLAAGYAIKTD
jgi:hypothetical protein